MGRICRDKDGNITEQSTARWDVDPAGGSVAIWPMDPEKMEPSGPAEVYGDWDAAAYLCRVVELIHPNRQINIPNLEAMIRAAAKDAAAMYPMPWANINTFWSMEPLLGPVDMSAAEGLPQWVILGAETGSRPDKVTPRREWVDQITEFCAENEIPVFYKDNLRAYFPDLPPSALPWGDPKGTTTEWAAHFMGRFERPV